MTDEIKLAIERGALENKKIAMFHLQVLVNAEALEGVDPTEFCRELGVPGTYTTEFRKMVSLRKLLRSEGFEITRR